MPRFMFRLLSFSIILGAIPVISIGIISYFIASGDIEEKVQESNMQILLQTQMRIEQVLKTLELSALQYVNSPAVLSSQNESLTEVDFTVIKDLSKGLYNLQTFAGISEAYLVNLDQDWVLNFSSFTKLSNFEKRDQFLSYAEHPNSLFWLTDSKHSDATTEEGFARPLLSMVLKIPVVPRTTNPIELLVVDIPKSEIEGLIAQNEKLGQSYILDRDGRNFVFETDHADYSEINDLVFRTVMDHSQKQGFLTHSVNGEKVGVTFRASEYNEWIYVSAVSMNELTKETKKIAFVTIYACLIIFVIVGVVAFYGSRRMYSPIRRLFEYTQEIGVHEESPHKKDELLLIEERFRNLFSTGKRLEQQVTGQFVQLKEYFVLKLFTGQISESDFAYRARTYNFPADWKSLGVLTLQIDTLHETRFREEDRDLLLFAINNIVGELIPQNQRFSPIVIDQSQVTLIASHLEDPVMLKHELHSIAEMIKGSIEQYLQLKISIGISRPFHKYADTVRAFGESLEALKSRISLGNEIILHYDDIDTNQDMEAAVYSHLKLLEDQLVNALKLGDSSKVNEILEEYISAIVEKEVYFNEYPLLMIQLISKVFQVVHDQGVPVKKVLGERASIEYFIKLNTLDEIVRWFKVDLFQPVIELLNRQAESQFVNIANQMVKLIHERYDQDISLESVAAMLNFHPVYLSRVFKKELGINFSEYLTEYRMNIAKTWLENTNLKISDIGEKLKYTNTSAFIRTFRRVVGMTPGQYRELHNKD